jgi:hypothetical protein
MRLTSFHENGTIETGNCTHFSGDPVTSLEADDHLKVSHRVDGTRAHLLLAHDDDDEKEEKRPQMVDVMTALLRCLDQYKLLQLVCAITLEHSFKHTLTESA